MVLFLHNTSKVEGEPYPNLRKEKGGRGVPTLVFENEPFFGQDRLDLLLWRLKQSGLKKRGGG